MNRTSGNYRFALTTFKTATNWRSEQNFDPQATSPDPVKIPAIREPDSQSISWLVNATNLCVGQINSGTEK
jgi:hypothetical protein